MKRWAISRCPSTEEDLCSPKSEIEILWRLYTTRYSASRSSWVNNNIRYATIISLVTLLEIELNNYCVELQRALSIKVKYEDFKGSILEQFKIYTSRLANLDINFENQLWSSLKDVVELRNCIVHHDGYAEDFYGRKFNRIASIENLTKRYKSIKIDERDIIILDKNACKDFITIVKTFLTHIYECAFKKFPEKRSN